jgi:hypothetical protein
MSRQVRAGRDHPSGPAGADRLPVHVQRIYRQVDRLCWAGILLGLAFTMTNVQSFAAAGARAWSLARLAAWLLDPMVSLVLLAILRAEQLTARQGIHTGGWVRGAKWFTLSATYVMNCWGAFTAGSAALVVLHSVPPSVVFVATEAVTTLRTTLTDAVPNEVPFTNPDPAVPVRPAEPAQVAPASAAPRRTPKKTGTTAGARTSFAEYLAVARAAREPDTAVTPAWAREVTGCSRGLSSRLAAVMNGERS